MNAKSLAVVAITFTVAGPVDAQIPGGAFTTTTFDQEEGRVQWIALARGADGLGLIAYYDDTNLDLKVAHCSNPSCSSVTIATLDSAGFVGRFPALAIGADGLGIVAYYDDTNSDLKVAHCSDTNCTTATTATLDSGGQVGWDTSITIGADGLGLVVYRAVDTGDVKVAHCANITCTGAAITTIDSTSGRNTSVTIGVDGYPLIAYSTSVAVRVAHCTDTGCTSAEIASVDNRPAGSLSLTLGIDGVGLIGYFDHSQEIRSVHCNDIACSSADVATLDGTGGVGGGIGIALGPDGLGLISYYGGTPSIIHTMVAHCNDTACSSANKAVVDNTGGGSSIAVGSDGLALLAYLDVISFKVAHQAPRGDFNADGRQDFVWRRDGTGDNLVWVMNGVNLVSAAFTNPSTLADSRWKLVGTNDFNQDARTDLLWRHADSGENVVWLMNGTNLLSGTFTTPSLLGDVRWQMAGTDDFDRDGRADILWRHAESGELVLWYMNGTTLSTGTFLTPSSLPDIGWKVGGTGDFNRDGKPDLLWHHQGSGQLVVWYMNGSGLTSGTFTNPPALPDIAWSVAAIGDYNADAHPDVVWRNQSSGQTVVWLMNGASLASGTFTNPSTFPDTNWRLVGPR